MHALCHVTVFGRAIHSLSKIGEELYIEAVDNGVCSIVHAYIC